VEPRSHRDLATLMVLETEAKPQRRASEVEPGFQRTDADPMGLRTKAELEGRRNPAEAKGWRDEAQLKARKSMAQAERCLTNVEPEGRGSLVDSGKDPRQMQVEGLKGTSGGWPKDCLW